MTQGPALTPPPLTNNCFAMPRGTHWTPVDDALDHLRQNLHGVTATETIATSDALGRVLAVAPTAIRSHPPAANSAVDGYGFAHSPDQNGATILPLHPGRSAAGVPFDGSVPAGHALRILTGAILPAGVDTVILEEDVNTDGTQIAFQGPLKKGANCRDAGEDITQGQHILAPGRVLTPGDLGTLTAVGIADVTVQKRLRVGVLSTGDELRKPGEMADLGHVYDANRPMLQALVMQWGYDVCDLGIAPDDNTHLRAILNDGAAQCDVILTSGGASAGDEDHMSRLLRETGSMQLWRIAMKPGRPLALGLWDNVPVFGLPGNPVAAIVCALIFARPALSVLSGAAWISPQGFDVPAAFTKTKKQGRREYLRARIRNGRVETFPSEGSGRVSGLSWAEGLVELGDEAQHIEQGQLVRFIPFRSFDL